MVFCCTKLFCVPAFIKITTFCFITIHFKPGECEYMLYFPSLGEFFFFDSPDSNSTSQSHPCSQHMLSRVQLFATSWTVACQALCPQDCPGKNTRVGCHFSLQGDPPDPGIELTSTTLQADSLSLSHQGNPEVKIGIYNMVRRTGKPGMLWFTGFKGSDTT